MVGDHTLRNTDTGVLHRKNNLKKSYENVFINLFIHLTNIYCMHTIFLFEVHILFFVFIFPCILFKKQCGSGFFSLKIK